MFPLECFESVDGLIVASAAPTFENTVKAPQEQFRSEIEGAFEVIGNTIIKKTEW